MNGDLEFSGDSLIHQPYHCFSDRQCDANAL